MAKEGPAVQTARVIVRYLEYLSALARERHFARAAAACNVTQPTLSAGIKQLEESLGVLIVERRQRFVGFTVEGERVLTWAHRVLAGYSSLEQELSELREGLEGQIRLGAIPVSLPPVALLTAAFAARHPRTRFQVTSHSSVEIQRGLDDFTLDAGITYLDNEPLVGVRTDPLYRERYVLITHDKASFAGLQSISWRQAATLPLCLLTPDMQNRRIIDAIFRAAGEEVQAVMETNSIVTLWSHIRFGPWSTVVPHTFLLLLGRQRDVIALSLTEPEASHLIGLAIRDGEPVSPLARELEQIANKLDLSAEIERQVAAMNYGLYEGRARS
jgi:DNA-binding transcriptional LysR family regulator